MLQRMNEQLREREEIYIEKLMRLEEGLENQHSQFIKLQDLYTELFQSYKKKQEEVAECILFFIQWRSDSERLTDISNRTVPKKCSQHKSTTIRMRFHYKSKDSIRPEKSNGN